MELLSFCLIFRSEAHLRMGRQPMATGLKREMGRQNQRTLESEIAYGPGDLVFATGAFSRGAAGGGAGVPCVSGAAADVAGIE